MFEVKFNKVADRGFFGNFQRVISSDNTLCVQNQKMVTILFRVALYSSPKNTGLHSRLKTFVDDGKR